MLRKFRSHHIKTVFWILLVVIVPSFIFWGVSSLVKSKKENTAFTLNGKIIDYARFRQFMTTAQLFYRLNMGEDFLRKVTQPLLESKAVELILFMWKAQKENITVSDEEVVEAVKNAFSVNGVFDEEQYKQKVSFLGLSPRSFEEHMRTILITQKVLDKFVRNVEVSDEEVRELYQKENRKIQLRYITVPRTRFKGTETATDAELASFFEKHKDEFRTEPRITLTYIVVPKDENEGGIAKIMNSLGADTTLKEASQALSVPVKTASITKTQGPPDEPYWSLKINELAFSMPLHTVSAPVDTQNAYIIFEAIDIQKGTAAELTQVKDTVRKEAVRAKEKEAAHQLAETVLSQLKNTVLADLEKTAAQNGITFSETEFLHFNEVADVLNVPRFPVDAFSLKKGEVFGTLLENPEGFIIVQLADTEPADEAAFSQKKQALLIKIKGNKVFTRYLEFISSLQKEAHLVKPAE